MTTANQIIQSFLATHELTGPRRLDVAILFAESMMRELQVVQAEWRAAADTLQVMKRKAIAAAN